MAKIICPSCSHSFDPNSKSAYGARAGAAAAGGISGAIFGKKIGLVGRGLGMAATVPLAIMGAVVGWQTAGHLAKCPRCKKPFKT
ncbi:hypothetical protein [Stenotrophomonas sp. SMYL86]|uniref:hypothetical protein n=1 Tax=Stenotrophomonas sp. SMYL86 TaxID=3076044 RepID=UPI002E7776B7|nr:hypothetical protein [Stenotrophomonas sp. SMYL86]